MVAVQKEVTEDLGSRVGMTRWSASMGWGEGACHLGRSPK